MSVIATKPADAGLPESPALRPVRLRAYGTAGRATLGISLAGVALLVAAWTVVTRFGLVTPLFLPSPGEVWE
ncbi:MAG: hypothetical protein ACRYGP_28850 [Janthinobacterium lividum]